jgi:hypothetical protein
MVLTSYGFVFLFKKKIDQKRKKPRNPPIPPLSGGGGGGGGVRGLENLKSIFSKSKGPYHKRLSN